MSDAATLAREHCDGGKDLKMTVAYAVTFEFEHQAPITTRGTVAASTMPTCFARAARQAVASHPGLHWSSMVCVLLERLPETTADARSLVDGTAHERARADHALAGELLERGVALSGSAPSPAD